MASQNFQHLPAVAAENLERCVFLRAKLGCAVWQVPQMHEDHNHECAFTMREARNGFVRRLTFAECR